MTLAIQMMHHHHHQTTTSFDTNLTFQQQQAIKEEMMDVGQETAAQEPAGAAQQNVDEPTNCDQVKNTTGTAPSPAANTPTLCGGCGFKIADRFYLVAVDKAWHSECLRCDECRRPLDTALSCFARQSRIYCRDDYYR